MLDRLVILRLGGFWSVASESVSVCFRNVSTASDERKVYKNFIHEYKKIKWDQKTANESTYDYLGVPSAISSPLRGQVVVFDSTSKLSQQPCGSTHKVFRRRSKEVFAQIYSSKKSNSGFVTFDEKIFS